MRGFKAIALLIAGLFFTLWMGVAKAQEDKTPPRIIHVPVLLAEQGEEISIEAVVTDDESGVLSVTLYYRRVGEEFYDSVEMSPFYDSYTEHIPGPYVIPEGVEYYIVALDVAGNEATVPEMSPEDNPFRISVTPVAALEEAPIVVSGSPPEVVILSPEVGERLGPAEVVIATSLYDKEQDIDLKSIRLEVDGQDVTEEAQITLELIIYVPKRRLPPGEHTVTVEVMDLAGNRPLPTSWHFYVEEIKRRVPAILKLSGNIDLSLKRDRVTGDSLAVARRNEPLWTNTGRLKLVGGYGWFKWTGLAFITTDETRWKRTLFSWKETDKTAWEQPRDRYTLDLSTPYLKLTFGDTRPYFSPLVLWGQRVRGIGAIPAEFKLKAGIFGLNLVYGEINRLVEGKKEVEIDTTTGQLDTSYVYGTYSRKLYGVRTTFGTERGARFGVSLLKVKDDLGSIQIGTKPKDNIVLGSDFRLNFYRRRVEFTGEVAVSFLADDIAPGAFSKVELDTMLDDEVDGKIRGVNIPIDPKDLEDIFVLNASLKPLDPRELSMLSYGLGFRAFLWDNLLKINYQSVGPSYNSLGNPSLVRDKQGIRVRDNLRLMEDKLLLSFSYDQFRDNLLNEENKSTTNSSTIAINISYFPEGLPSFNLGYRIMGRDNGLEDTTKVVQTETGEDTIKVDPVEDITSTYSIGTGYNFYLWGASSTLGINLARFDREDKFNPASRMKGTVTSLNLRSEFTFPLTLNLGFSTNQSDYSGTGFRLDSYTYSLRGDYRLMGERVRTFAEVRWTTTEGGQVVEPVSEPWEYDTAQTIKNKAELIPATDARRTQFRLGAQYNLLKSGFISAEFGLIDYRDRALKWDPTHRNDVAEPVGYVSKEANYRERYFSVKFTRKF